MSVQRFIGANSRDAMRQVRAALGDDALILANRRVDEGVEILALAEEMPPTPPAETRSAPPAPVRPSPPAGRGGEPPAAAPERAPAAPRPPEPPAAPTGGAPADFSAFTERLLGEMQDLRSLLVGQAAAQGNGQEDNRRRLNRRLQAAGYGNALARELLDSLPVELIHADGSEALAWLERQLATRLAVLDDERRLLDEGGVFALLGPTGVGKTTTTAKLAARYVMRHGAGSVALVTTDSYRIGAHEQLRIYARLLGAEVHALDAEAPLGELLETLADKRLVIIDTVGMSQRDQRLVDQVARLGGTPRPVRRLLLLNAASHGETLEDVVVTYQRASRAAGAPLYGAILTKVDEAPRLGAVLDIAIRHELCLHYVSHGQQVPEDLRLADRQALVSRSLAVNDEDSSFVGEPLDWQPGPSAQRWRALSRSLLGQGRTLAAVFDQLRERVGGFANLETAWPLLGLPLDHQRARVAGLMALPSTSSTAFVEPPRGILWSRTAPLKGSDWRLPAIALNGDDLAQVAPWPAHRQSAGETEKLVEVAEEGALRRHFLPRCPSSAARRYLGAAGDLWVAQAQANSRVAFDGARRTLKELADDAQPVGDIDIRHRGRPVRLGVRRLSVEGDEAMPLTAWFAALVDPDTGRRLGQRYWFSAAPDLPLATLATHLAHDELATLARRAWQWLEPDAGEVDGELRVWLAASLAALAVRLDQEGAEWAMDLRGHLLALLGGNRKRSAAALLEALWHLFAARDAFLLAGGAREPMASR
ncbi:MULTISPECIES: flagellar biosynthesis protein FlhF [unclassified Modicisalibacter]|uniref:flagellar biosynthesis protein FlhF n=1 Tax=unclassified Modicisalibacter TaxID=2679913 RepID=UPI001CCBC5A3|nr:MULTISPECIES: flagellar biosynthesis protein FlhF [unclassified Modicisalibacter]MBZ9556941.1 flagellar biosynthesis protein FlhF [Modicisalibacter sp. R2A 31.J]MBZ9574346.1 flagellar biosynthesis protein FlhF [Modicisalibacter sp. MOD 31.J]